MPEPRSGSLPIVDPTASVAASAVLEGDVRIGPHSRVLAGAVLTAGDGVLTVGSHVIVMEHAVLRATHRFPLTVGNHCVIGPHTNISGATIGDEVFIATGASVFPAARLGRGSEVRINGVVQLRTVLEPGATVPIGWIAVGDPAVIAPPERHDEIWEVQRELDFPGFVFGVDRTRGDVMVQLTERYSRALGAASAD
jgi:carbonic anhydrase/acetyltransferase-like protein (isoleucine patch superfamily)